jgi:hypothetical protein
MTSVDTKKPITRVTRFRTPDGLRFGTYQAAQKHWSREKLRQWFYANAPWTADDAPMGCSVRLDELVDRLRQEWHISKRTAPTDVKPVAIERNPLVDAVVAAVFGKGACDAVA